MRPLKRDVFLLSLEQVNSVSWWQEGGVSLERDWLPSEDELLARGILRFGQDTGRLRQYFLPGRLASEIPPRIRQRLTARAGDNPVKVSRT